MENKLALEKLTRARSRLLLSDNYDMSVIGSLSIKYPFIAAEKYQGYTIETAATNGINIVFSPGYIEKLSLKHCIFLIAHETLHCMFLHHTRRAGRDVGTWNKAGDYIINDILISDQIGDVMPDILFDPKYHGLNIEHVYKMLTDDSQTGDDDQPDDDKIINNPAGGVIDIPKDLNPADIESELKQALTSADIFAEKAAPGTSAGSLIKKIIQEIRAPGADWRQLFKNWFDANNKSDFSFSRPRHSGGYILPGLYSEDLGKLIIAMDVSGSVVNHAGAVESFQNELNIMRESLKFDCDVIYFHSDIERIESFQKHEPIKIEVIETGGTKLKPVLDYIFDTGLKNQITGLVVFTDMEIFDFPEFELGYKILFCQYGDQETYKTDIGETIKINPDA